MTVEIPPEFAEFVQNVIRQGEYQTESQVVGEALRLLRERERRLEDLRAEIQPALERLDRGEGVELDDESLEAFFAGIKARAGQRRDAEQRPQ